MKYTKIFTAVLCFACTTASYSHGQSQLPQPDPEFKGKIGETYRDSTPGLPDANESRQR